MELQTIAERTQLALRKLRYVLDHRMLPGLRIKTIENAVGQPRSFTEFEAFGIACAATLLEGGLKREAVVQFVDGLCLLTWEGPPVSDADWSKLDRHKRLKSHVLYQSFVGSGPVQAMLGDGINIRVIADTRDTGWRQPQTLARLSDDYCPRVSVLLDLAHLRDQMRRHTR